MLRERSGRERPAEHENTDAFHPELLALLGAVHGVDHRLASRLSSEMENMLRAGERGGTECTHELLRDDVDEPVVRY